MYKGSDMVGKSRMNSGVMCNVYEEKEYEKVGVCHIFYLTKRRSNLLFLFPFFKLFVLFERNPS